MFTFLRDLIGFHFTARLNYLFYGQTEIKILEYAREYDLALRLASNQSDHIRKIIWLCRKRSSPSRHEYLISGWYMPLMVHFRRPCTGFWISPPVWIIDKRKSIIKKTKRLMSGFKTKPLHHFLIISIRSNFVLNRWLFRARWLCAECLSRNG